MNCLFVKNGCEGLSGVSVIVLFYSQFLLQSIKTLGKFVPPSFFDKGIGALLPQAYKKFYKEWKLTQPTAVHYVPEEGKWKRDDVTGEV